MKKRPPLVVGANLVEPPLGTIVFPNGSVAEPAPSAPKTVPEELAGLFSSISEAVLCRLCLIATGTRLDTKDLATRGTIETVQEEDGTADTFCWDGKPVFIRRIRFTDDAVLMAIVPVTP